ncbi:MAG: DUF4153 domain-containing protein, partial [Eubacteriales bacterium]|nr:DUF4153 domain-containing protein [Eubacteriales bacterium]
AFAFSVVTLIRIQLDWPQQEPYNFLFNCLHFAFAFGAVFSMAAITIAQSRYNDKKAFLTANLLGAAAAAAAFLLLYFLGGTDPAVSKQRFETISTLAGARISAAILISFLVFIVTAGYPKKQSDFSRSFFMTHKAFFIALLYGIVIMAGASGVAGAVQALLYHDMSYKVYMVIGTLTGFLAFTIFLGYFPDFRKGVDDDHREIAQNQPRFIEVLLGYIIVPIILALTVVLFLWSGRTILTGDWPVFERLAGIATTYSLVGLWLYIMITHHESGLAKFYRRVYPFAALIILAFEAAALFVQLSKSGLKLTEYSFLLVWIVAVTAAVLLILIKSKAYLPVVAMICAVAVFAVFPLVGYHALPVSSQVDRLEKLLVSEGMLENNEVKQAEREPETAVKESITDAVYYIANAENAKVPVWFDRKLNQNDVFEETFGFKPARPEFEDPNSGGFLGTSLYLKSESVDISDYNWSILMQPDGENENKSTVITGAGGVYTIDWDTASPDGIPVLNIKLNDRVILEQDMNGYVDRISDKYPPDSMARPAEATFEDMSVRFENEEVAVLLVFNHVEINLDPQADKIHYWINLNTAYLKEKQ